MREFAVGGIWALYLYLFPSTLTIILQAIAINETWLHRCDHGQLFTSAALQDDKIPYSTVFAGLLNSQIHKERFTCSGIPDSYYNLFYKSLFAFHYIYRNISSEFDWYYKVRVQQNKSFLLTCNAFLCRQTTTHTSSWSIWGRICQSWILTSHTTSDMCWNHIWWDELH